MANPNHDEKGRFTTGNGISTSMSGFSMRAQSSGPAAYAADVYAAQDKIGEVSMAGANYYASVENDKGLFRKHVGTAGNAADAHSLIANGYKPRVSEAVKRAHTPGKAAPLPPSTELSFASELAAMSRAAAAGKAASKRK